MTTGTGITIQKLTNIESYDRYELLRFNKWNRRLLNLYWIFNAIVLLTEIALFFIIDAVGTLFFPAEYHLIHFILIPTLIMLGATVLCEIVVHLSKKRHRGILPYAMTITSIVYCSVLLSVHNIVVVLCVTFIVPIIISQVYDNKMVLRVTAVCSLAALIGVSVVVINFGNPEYQYLDLSDIITASVILIVTYLLCGTVMNRNRDIIRTLVQAEHSAHELERAKSRAEAEAEMMAKFLANMSHEIRTPMNGIIGVIDLVLSDKKLSLKHRDYLKKALRSADGLMAIVNDILDITKIEAGEFNIEQTPFYLHDVLTECKVAIMHDAKKKGIKLFVHDETSLAEKIIGDPTKLRQALLNFLSNAVKFTEKGSVKLTLKSEKSSENTTLIYFEIADTGIGITPEQQDVIFEPFKQADDSTTRKYGGTGLGLSITKAIIERMGGKIRVDSTPEKGSIFSFGLAFELFDETDEPQKDTQKRVMYRPIFEGDALVCEDNELNRQVVTESLEKLGFSVTVAENGKLGIDEVNKRKDNPFDAIIMDIHMPVMDGFSAAAELIKTGIKTPIIAMTADAMPADRERCLELGMVDYISKPFRLGDIWRCLLKYINPVGEVPDDQSDEVGDYIDEAVIDRRLGIKNSAGNVELYEEISAQFAEKERGAYDRLVKALENKDYSLARHITHEEKGSAQVIGAVHLTEILGDLNSALKSEDLQDYAEIMDNYSKELDNVLEHIRSQNSAI